MFNIYLQEKAIALKIGRQKKIQIIDGQQVEVLTGDDEDDEVKKIAHCTISVLGKYLSGFLVN